MFTPRWIFLCPGRRLAAGVERRTATADKQACDRPLRPDYTRQGIADLDVLVGGHVQVVFVGHLFDQILLDQQV